MNILYIIGNGFDLNLGLKTSYKDFFDFYQSVESSRPNIINLKNNISNNYKNWSDLELALGQYTEELKATDDFDEVFEDIGEQLAEYLKKEESKFDKKIVNKETFFLNLVKPESYLQLAERNIITDYKHLNINKSWVIDIVTFNYTKIIDKIIGSNSPIKLGHHLKKSASVLLRSVEHIHGYVDNRMVMGVNDISQIKNKEFHHNVDVLEAIVKNMCNKAYGHTIENKFTNKILRADFICFFGTSIGDTDNMWWKLIGERIKKAPVPIIIFTKGEEVISPRIGYKTNRTKRKMRNYFLRKTKLTKEEIERISGDIFVALDTAMFKDIIKQFN